MTFLPIVERELRVASQKSGPRRWRMAAVIIACVVAGGALLIFEASSGSSGAAFGGFLFGFLKWPCYIFACATGMFLTSDCLAEEKREGTLGLLFLTDLRGYDVVMGKLVSSSVRAAYGMLAVFPIMAVALTFGGVTPLEFRHVVLLLCNTLFFSLALGMFVSSISRDSHKAMNGTLLLLIIFVIALPLIQRAMADLHGGSLGLPFAFLSPSFAMGAAASTRVDDFWWSMAWVNALGWIFLGLACWLTPRTWQAGNARRVTAMRSSLPFLAVPAMKPATRAKMLDENPIGWLVARDQWMHRAARIVVFLVLLVTVAGLAVGAKGELLTRVGGWGATLAVILFELWVAAQIARFYVEGRGNGFLQILLVTPLDAGQIVRGHWRGLRRLLLPPVVALLFMDLCRAIFRIIETGMSGGFSVHVGNGSNSQTVIVGNLAGTVAGTVLGLAGIVTALLSVGWFAMWMGLTARKTNVAVAKAFIYTRVVPQFILGLVVAVISIPITMSLGRLSVLVWVMPVIYGVLGIGMDLALIALARPAVLKGLRKYARADDTMMSLRPIQPPVSMTAINAPPVIGPITR